MRITCIGGGPASLYFAILAKKAFPASSIEVIERNRADDTFGWGVVFSDETLGHFEKADPETYAEMRRLMRYWTDIDTFAKGERVTSTGHGFCGLSRKRLLEAFHARAKGLGVTLRFETEVTDLEAVRRGADLVVGGDGVQSTVRRALEERVKPTIEWGRCRFSWLGTTKPLDAFTFVFRESEHGLFVVHAYPFEPGLSTWIVECREETWARAGLEQASEEETVAFVERLFAKDLGGHRILANKSVWRRFPTLSCASWHDGHVVLLGDSAHTAHFSIGSGTKLAMEDAIALVDALVREGGRDVPKALAAYEAARKPEVERVQRAAEVSRTWFEHAERYRAQPPLELTFNLLTRSKRITYDNLARRDPALVARVRDAYATKVSAPRRADGTPPPPCLAPASVRSLRLPNRIVVSPMCQYSAVDGVPQPWHFVHLGGKAIGGAGLVFAEMTDVSPEGRITLGCTGLWNEAQAEAWRRVTDFVHAHTKTKIGIQLAHAGRKGSTTLPWEGDEPLAPPHAWTTLAPSAIPWDEGWPTPKAMDAADLARVRAQFASAAERAVRAGFDAIELHMAHGYLLSSFLTPLSNLRTDAYGGSLENRLRFPLEVLGAVRAAWPRERPLFVRISAHDWMPDGSGITDVDAVEIARALFAHGADVVDVSSGGTSPKGRPVYGRMYQVPFADRIRHETGGTVMVVGGIQGHDHVNTILAAGRADLCAIARGHLVDAQIALRASTAYGWPEAPWPVQYGPAKPRPAPSPPDRPPE